MEFYGYREMDTQEACPGFMILEEGIAEEDETIVTDWYLKYSFLHYEKRSFEIEFSLACFR